MQKIKIATAVIMTRGENGSLEVFLGRRSPQIRFFGGYWAFPGGNIKDADSHAEDEPVDAILIRCAIRELFEETNILSTTLGHAFDDDSKKYLKKLLEQDHAAWQDLLKTHPQSSHRMTPVCRITTPPFVPVRYDTQFMHVHLSDRETPVIDNYELVDGKFFNPAEAVSAWERGEIDIPPPVLFLLRLIANNDLDTFIELASMAAEEFAGGALHPVFFSPGIFMASLQTPTLPPATTTNTLIVGNEQLYIIDPATPDAAEQQRLFAKMDSLIETGKKFESILLTHHHVDHVGAVNAVSQCYQLPVRAHALCYERIEPGYIRGEPVADNEQIPLGTAPDGSPDWHLTAVHTPGHAIDHLCYLENRYQAAIVGDMLSTVSTILIDPPEGHMRTYNNSLEKLLEYPMKTLYPAHGPAHRDGHALIKQYLQHRLERETMIIAALTPQPQSIDALLPVVYNDVPEAALAIASRSLLAGLIKLEEDGICKQGRHGWLLVN